MEAEELTIAPGAVLKVISRTEEELVLEAHCAGGGAPPPSHLHPEQDEHFEILAGTMRARIGGEEAKARTGETLEVARGTPHKMWNDGEQAAAMRWVTRPAGRTLDWFRELAGLQRGEPLGDPETLLSRYAEVFQLSED